nr:ATP-binding protein [Maliibacterium massiliense]
MSEAILYRTSYEVEAQNFAVAGEVSSAMKKQLRQLGVRSDVVRRIAIAAYECELNLVIHSLGGAMSLDITQEDITLRSKDRGPGIADIDLAMREGFSTASEQVRLMGFGAGMGLPNMRRCCDHFSIASKVPEGTEICMQFQLSK